MGFVSVKEKVMVQPCDLHFLNKSENANESAVKR